MLNRIKQILKEYGLQYSDFAEKIGVSRGTISHILNGRMQNGIRVYNDPSKDTIDKILKTFPDISPAWLFSGTGSMYNNEHIQIMPISPTFPGQLDLFNEKQSVELPGKLQESEYLLKNDAKTPENKTISTVIQNVNPINNITKKIDKIIIFFSDKTFTTFISEE